MKFVVVILACLCTFPAGATQPADCSGAIACHVGDRSYHVRVPDDWDGKSKLPVLLHFHGWGRQGTLTVKHGRIAGATKSRGVLLIGPNGRGRSWNFWASDTDDIAFTNSVLDDAAKRWPVDRGKIFVSGYSYGSAMAWRYACSEGNRIHTLLAISGSVDENWSTCVSPVNVRHVHGLADTVMDYPLGDDGAVEAAVKLWRERNKCLNKPDHKHIWNAVKILPFLRHTWTSCATGKSVRLDVHQRGHFIPRKWIARQLDQLL